MHVEVRLQGELGEHVAAVIGGRGWYATAEEYICDLIRRDVAAEQVGIEAFKAELQDAFTTPEA